MGAKTRKVYSNKDYNSGDGMLTSVWGPYVALPSHYDFNYPVSTKDKIHYMNFIKV